MPVYEYVCQDCKDRFDARVASFEEADGARCRSCSSANVRRLVSRVAFMSVGSDIPLSASSSGSDGCCGGSCGCRHDG